MAKNRNRAAHKATQAVKVAAQAAHEVSPATRADLGRRASGAAGAHAASLVRRGTTAGQRNRMGSRSSRSRAAIRDFS